jgi:hypothetical protein
LKTRASQIANHRTKKEKSHTTRKIAHKRGDEEGKESRRKKKKEQRLRTGEPMMKEEQRN